MTLGNVLLLLAGVSLAVSAAVHALLTKRDSKTALLWVVLTIFSPLFGGLFYFLFGINRIRRSAVRLRDAAGSHEICSSGSCANDLVRFRASLTSERRYLRMLNEVLERTVPRPLVAGNRIDPLDGGDAAYAAMLESIEGAKRSVSFSSYIFERKGPGERFAEVLGAAQERGVEVRVMIDDAGTRYSWPSIVGLLEERGVTVKRFMPNRVWWRLLTLNLRNHRKLLVVDGKVGFTGGMNVRENYWSASAPDGEVSPDMHFRVEGPVVAQLQEVFVEDWEFCCGEELEGELWFPRLEQGGDVFCRGIADGPDEDFEVMQTTILGAIATARRRLRIVTPYFLPGEAMISALNLAALRGVKVEIVLPKKNNIPVVRWASRALYARLLEKGCVIYETEGKFDHTKLFTVDGEWSLIGSTNWDPRSLRLNFEFNLACYSRGLADRLGKLIDAKMEKGKVVTLVELEKRGRWERLRDGAAGLLSPAL